VDNAELRSEDGYAFTTARMRERPEIALVTLDDGTRFALPSDVANRVLTAPGLTDDQKMEAMLTYPNLVEAKTDANAAAEVVRLESQSLGECPPDAVSMEIMETPELREAAFRVPRPIQEHLDALPQQGPQGGASP